MANNNDDEYVQTDLYQLETVNPGEDVDQPVDDCNQLVADGPVGETWQIIKDIYKGVKKGCIFAMNIDLTVKLKTNVQLTAMACTIKYGQVGGETPIEWKDMADIKFANNKFAHTGSKAAISWLVQSTPRPFRVVIVWSVHPILCGTNKKDMLGVGFTEPDTRIDDVLRIVHNGEDEDEIDVDNVKIKIRRYGRQGNMDPVACGNGVAEIKGAYFKVDDKTTISVTIAHSEA